MGAQENLISDHHEGNSEGRWEKRDDQQGASDSFVVDIETLFHGDYTNHHHHYHQGDTTTTTTANSRTMTSFQRNPSRKGSSSSQQRGKSTVNTPQKDSSTVSLSLGGGGGHVLDDSSKASLIGDCTSKNITLTVNVDNPLVVMGCGVAIVENCKKPQQMMANVTAAETGNNKWGRRNSKQLRSTSSSLPWIMMDPRRIVFFFATLSSMGTIILIYFTLSMGKLNGASAAVGLD